MVQTYSEQKELQGISQIENGIFRWGCSISEFALETGFKYFQIPDIQGFIGYKVISNYAISYGDPICSREDAPLLASKFQAFCKENRLNLIFNVVTEQFAKWAIKNLCGIMIEMGEELIFNLQNDPTEGSKSRKLRNKISHATSLGLQAIEYIGQDLALEESIAKAGREWLKGRKGPQIYLSTLNLFRFRNNKRWFYVKEGERVISAALLSRLETYQGYLLKYLVTVPDAPRGTSELLVSTIFETLRQEKWQNLSYGIVPAGKIGEIEGLGPLSKWMVSLSFKLSKLIFDLEHRKEYWLQFSPRSEPMFILFDNPKIHIKDAYAIFKSLQVEF